MAKQIDYPADTVDSNGKAWKTVGENIRNGAKSDSLTTAVIDELLNELYPVGYVFLGVLPKLLQEKFVWEPGIGHSYKSRVCVMNTEAPVGDIIRHLSDRTAVVLSTEDVTKFNAATGLNIETLGVTGIPVCYRVA